MANATYHLISEKEESFERRLIDRLESCQSAILASAFFTKGALEAIETALLNALENSAKITFLLGRFDYVTEPRAVNKLLKLAEKFPKQLTVLFDSDFGFHYKLAIFQVKKKSIVIIGSSNLTPKGLATDGEVNLEIVSNLSVYRQAKDCLEKRIEVADLAADAIKAYERAFKRAKQFRRMRGRWHSKGRKTWASKKRKIHFVEPAGEQFTFCLTNVPEEDETLDKNIRKGYHQTQTKQSFPFQWVHEWKSCDRLYREGQMFVIRDDRNRRFGFAVCNRKMRVLDEHDSREPIIFYRFRSGWNASFSTQQEYERNVFKAGLGRLRVSHSKIKTKRVRTLIEYFRKRQRAAR